jgi:predicted nucleic acid-binding protein
VLIALERREVTRRELEEGFPNSRFVASAISVYEQAYGAYFLAHKGLARKAETIIEGLKEFETYPLTGESALLAAKISADLISQGITIDPRDLFIGAICICNGLELLTSNIAHFDRLTTYGLRVHDVRRVR